MSGKAIVAIIAVVAVTACSCEELYLDTCATSAEQSFQVTKVNTKTLVSSKGGILRLELESGAGGDYGSHVFMNHTTSISAFQEWVYTPDGQFQYGGDHTQCIGPGYQPAQEGAWIWLNDCKSEGNTFRLTSAGQIQHKDSGLCLTRAQVTGCGPSLKETPWCDPKLSIDKRVSLLMEDLTPIEKISQLSTFPPALPKRRIPKYLWWTEAAHGVMADAPVTSFPASPAMAATRNLKLTNIVGSAISDEARAMYNAKRTRFPPPGQNGLNMFCPNINIVRDPRWGRGQESYGEDPFLSASLVREFVRGMQEGNDPRYLKLITTPKHYAAYSLENYNGIDRTEYDAKVSDADLLETYLPAFESAIREGRARSIMCSYNSVNGVPACANKRLLTTILREQWGFEGFVASDCDAVRNVYDPHHYTKTPEEAAAASLKAGMDLDCGDFFMENLPTALSKGLVTVDDIDTAFRRLFYHRIKLGMFDIDEIPYDKMTEKEYVATTRNKELALQAAKESIVLLKNSNNILPLNPAKLSSIAVIGPLADDATQILGNYNGVPARSDISTYLDGIRGYNIPTINYAYGCPVETENSTMIDEAVTAAKNSEVALLFVGLNNAVESEGHDRVQSNVGSDLELPGSQLDLVKAVAATKTPTIVCFVNGGAVAAEWIKDNIPVALEAFYGGQAAGAAFAQVIFGDSNPSARLPFTIYKSTWAAKTDFGDMAMHAGAGRTYKYVDWSEVLWPFGHGMSYSTFETSTPTVDTPHVRSSHDGFTVSVDVTNQGPLSGSEVIQVFAVPPKSASSSSLPRAKLVGFAKEFIDIDSKVRIDVPIRVRDLAVAITDGKTTTRRVLPGSYTLVVVGAAGEVGKAPLEVEEGQVASASLTAESEMDTTSLLQLIRGTKFI